MMQALIHFIQANKPYFDVAQALSSVVNLVAWCLALILLVAALRRGRVESITFGPIGIRIQEAVQATASAARAWKSGVPGQEVDVPRIRSTISRAFEPKILDNMTGKSILWVDDNPANNELAVRALRKFNLEIVQVTSTEAALAKLESRVFHLVISDMGRGMNMRAGYELLHLIRESGNEVPFFIFAGSDTPEFRREAAVRGAQLSTNDMLELVDNVVKYLGEKP